MTFITGLIIGGVIGLVVGSLGVPAPLFITNWWKKLFKQKELEQKH